QIQSRTVPNSHSYLTPVPSPLAPRSREVWWAVPLAPRARGVWGGCSLFPVHAGLFQSQVKKSKERAIAT
ncbi:MAG: hypothetical protein U1V56_14090, partial [Planktothrix rubescens PR221]